MVRQSVSHNASKDRKIDAKSVLDGLPVENNRLLTLCFCSLALTCTEVRTAENADENVDISDLIQGFELDDGDDLEYSHISRIPANIARIFWSELLDIKGLVSSNNPAEEDKEDLNSSQDLTTKSKKKSSLMRSHAYWKEFISEDERKNFHTMIVTKSSPNHTALEKIRKELSENNITSSLDDTSYSTSSLSDFFRNTLTTIIGEPSFEDDLLLHHDEFFQYVRETLLNSDLIELVVREKEIGGFIENQESYEGLNNLNYFLDEHSIASLKEFFNPTRAVEYFSPIVNTRISSENGKGPLPSMPSTSDVVKLARSYSLKANAKEQDGILYNNSRRTPIGDFQGVFDMSSNSCVKLVKLSRRKGGFAIGRRPIHGNRDHYFLNTFEIWNNIMAEACIKLYDPRFTFGGAKRRTSEDSMNSDSACFEIDRKVQLEQRTSYKDGTLAYALRMIPTHLMRAKRLEAAITLLRSKEFLFCRICVLGIEKTARQIRRDCEEIRLRIMARDKIVGKSAAQSENDTRRIVTDLFVFFKWYILERIAGIVDTDKMDQGRILHGIACSMERMGWNKEAMDFYRDALECKKSSSTFNSNSILATLTSLANGLIAQKAFEEGLMRLHEKLFLLRKSEGDNDLSIAKTLKSCAMVYGILAQYDSSISHYEEALDIEKKVLGDDKIEVHDTFNCLGLIYIVVEKFEKAVHCFEQTLRIGRFILGESHADVARAHYNLGRSLSKVQDYRQSIYHLSKALVWRTENLPDDHEDIAKTLYMMGSVYTTMDFDPSNFEKAVICIEDAIQITKNVYGAEHEEVGKRLSELADAYLKNGQFEKGIDTKVDVIQILKVNFGGRDIKLADAIKDLGHIYQEKGFHQQSLLCFKEVLEILDALPEKTLPYTQIYSDILHRIGNSYFLLAFYDSALEYYEKAYRARIQNSSSKVDIADSQYCIGLTYFQQENDEKALKYLTLAFKNRRAELGVKDGKVADVLHNLALVHKNCFEYTLSVSRATEAHKIREKIFGKKNAKVADTKYLIGIILSEMGKFSYALRFFSDALHVYQMIGFADLQPHIISNAKHWITFLKDKMTEKKAVDDALAKKGVVNEKLSKRNSIESQRSNDSFRSDITPRPRQGSGTRSRLQLESVQSLQKSLTPRQGSGTRQRLKLDSVHAVRKFDAGLNGVHAFAG